MWDKLILAKVVAKIWLLIQTNVAVFEWYLYQQLLNCF